MKILTFDPKKNKKVLCGELIGDVLFRWVKPEHFMNVVNGYGIQEVVFQGIVKSGCKKVVLKEEGTGQNWEARIDDWLYHSKIADYGHGKQRFLSMKFMRTHLLPVPDEEKERRRDESKQLALDFRH